MRTCLNSTCRVDISEKHANAKFCSTDCLRIDKNSRRRVGLTITAQVCPECEQEFPPDPTARRVTRKKLCVDCAAERNRKSAQRYYSTHPDRARDSARRWREANLDKARASTRESMRRRRLEWPDEVSLIKKTSRYGITVEWYFATLEAQGYACFTCPNEVTVRSAHVDHDHSCCDLGAGPKRACGRCVRGLLCGGCNRALGGVRDSVEALRNLADYLESYQAVAV